MAYLASNNPSASNSTIKEFNCANQIRLAWQITKFIFFASECQRTSGGQFLMRDLKLVSKVSNFDRILVLAAGTSGILTVNIPSTQISSIQTRIVFICVNGRALMTPDLFNTLPLLIFLTDYNIHIFLLNQEPL